MPAIQSKSATNKTAFHLHVYLKVSSSAPPLPSPPHPSYPILYPYILLTYPYFCLPYPLPTLNLCFPTSFPPSPLSTHTHYCPTTPYSYSFATHPIYPCISHAHCSYHPTPPLSLPLSTESFPAPTLLYSYLLPNPFLLPYLLCTSILPHPHPIPYMVRNFRSLGENEGQPVYRSHRQKRTSF